MNYKLAKLIVVLKTFPKLSFTSTSKLSALVVKVANLHWNDVITLPHTLTLPQGIQERRSSNTSVTLNCQSQTSCFFD